MSQAIPATMRAMVLHRPGEPLRLEIRPVPRPGPGQILLRVEACGVCRTDLHLIDGELPDPRLPIVPGHEIVGRVTQVGSAVKKHKRGDIVGVGCLVGSDQSCPSCAANLEQFCPHGVFTYNSPDKHGTAPVTYGGYSSSIVVDEHFALAVPANLSLPGVAPLLCAGITTYSPMRRWGDLKGKKVGVVGLGGLGHMGVKLSHALGAHTVAFTTSDGKRKDALAQKVLAMVFLDPSLRTRTSFEVAMFLHGGHGVVLEPGRTSWAWEMQKGVVMDGTTVEHIAEAARVLGRYADAVALNAHDYDTGKFVCWDDPLDLPEGAQPALPGMVSVSRRSVSPVFGSV